MFIQFVLTLSKFVPTFIEFVLTLSKFVPMFIQFVPTLSKFLPTFIELVPTLSKFVPTFIEFTEIYRVYQFLLSLQIFHIFYNFVLTFIEFAFVNCKFLRTGSLFLLTFIKITIFVDFYGSKKTGSWT